MFENLCDPEPPILGDAFRRSIVREGRRRQRRTRLTVCGVAAVPIVAASGFGLYLRSQSDELERVSIDGLVPATDPPAEARAGTTTLRTTSPVDEQAPPLARPVNVLVAGVDRRPPGSEVEGSRADTIAVVRIDPDRTRISILSLPRDLWITTADDDTGRLNSFSDGGRLVTIVSELLDVDLNHYVEVDFAGFVSLIDIVGGVTVAFDQPVRDTQTGFAADAGCVTLDGTDALAYVRSRKLETLDPRTNSWSMDPRGDLGRIDRQQDLISRLMASILTPDYDIGDKLQLLTDVVDDLTVDQSLDLDGVRAIFNAAALIGPDNLDTYDLTDFLTATTIGNQAVLQADPAGITSTVDHFLGRPDDSAPSQSPADTTAPEGDAPTTC